MESNKIDRLIEYIENLVAEMGWSYDENFAETPVRVVKWLMAEQYLTKENARQLAKKHLSKTFPTKNKQLVMVGPSKVFSLCPHHLQVIEYDVWVGYIPRTRAVGLSKLARVPDTFGQYPFIQEDFTEEIANAIEKNLNPLGVMVVVKGVHNCMRVRGVKQSEATTMTSALRGVFLKPGKGKDPKTEMLELIKIQK